METKKAQDILDLVKRNYQEIAASFDATRKKEIWPEMRNLSARVNDGESVLDVGCGNGRLLEALADRKIKYLGTDNSEALIKLAKENYPNQQFLVADILNLDKITDNNFDYIFCLAVLQHIPSRELRLQALQQMKAKLSNSGHLIISNWNLWSSPKHRPLLLKNFWLKILGKYELDYNDLLFSWKNSSGLKVSERYYHAYTKKELKKLSRLAGFRILRLYRDKYNFWLILEKNRNILDK